MKRFLFLTTTLLSTVLMAACNQSEDSKQFNPESTVVSSDPISNQDSEFPPSIPTLNSETQRDLVESWNLVSIPVERVTSTFDLFSSGGQFDNIKSLWKWDGSLGSGSWKVYPQTGHYPELTTVTADGGYWVNARNSFTLTGTGISENDYDFVKGWNMIGYSHSASPTSVADFFSNGNYWQNSCGSGETVKNVWAWEANTWKIYFPDDADRLAFNSNYGTDFDQLTELSPGMAVWVNASRDSSPPDLTGCTTQPTTGDPITVAKGLLAIDKNYDRYSAKRCALLANGTVQCWTLDDDGVASTSSIVADLSNVTQLSTSGSKTCALISDGTAKCWKAGESPTLASYGEPAQNITQIALSSNDYNKFTCALYEDKTVKCVGSGDNGRLGTGNTDSSTVPTLVSGLENVTQIALGSDHACALLEDKTVKCWGEGYYGQLGQSNTHDSSSPVLVNDLSDVTQIEAYKNSTCAVLSDKTVKCWGNQSSSAYSVSDLSNVSKISIGSFFKCALLGDQTVKCWGSGSEGQIGDGNNSFSNSLTLVSDLSNVIDLSTGEAHACAVISDGTVKCWGFGLSGQLGNGVNQSASTPTAVVGLSNVNQISLGDYISCAHLNNGTAKCWGKGTFKQLGDGSFSDSNLAVDVDISASISKIVAGGGYACAQMDLGAVKCWGNGNGAQLGDGNSNWMSDPVDFSEAGLISNASQIAAGLSSSDYHCVLIGDGTVKCGTTLLSTISGIEGATQISTSGRHSCALLSDGTAKCWGNGEHGQLGNGMTLDSSSPVLVGNLSNIAQIEAGINQTCARLSNGTIECWGYGGNGELGNGEYLTIQKIPVSVKFITNAAHIEVGERVTCALLSSGQVQCWGIGYSGASGLYVDSALPTTIAGLSRVNSLSLGNRSACAALEGGSVKCWGEIVGGSSSSAVEVANLNLN